MDVGFILHNNYEAELFNILPPLLHDGEILGGHSETSVFLLILFSLYLFFFSRYLSGLIIMHAQKDEFPSKPTLT